MNTKSNANTDSAGRGVLVMIGVSAALFIANLYYAQPLIINIARDLGLDAEAAGSIVSASQLGYGIGLFLLVPLSDMVENRRLVLTCTLMTVIGIVGVATAQSAASFLVFAMIIGVFSSGAQVLLPYLTHMIPPAQRPHVIARTMAGILAAVMLARPAALLVSALFGWRVVYWFAALATISSGIAMWRMMPPRYPSDRPRYSQAILSMFALFGREARVQRRTLYQAILFGTFTMFWAVVPILLAERFGLSATQIAIFALVGAGGLLAAPLAGYIAGRGGTSLGTALASLMLAGSFLISIWSFLAGALLVMVMAALVIDGAVQVSQVLSRVMVLEVAPAIRGRINAVYMTIVYVSGAVGSILGVSLYYRWGWPAVAACGIMAGSTVFLATLAEKRKRYLLRPKGPGTEPAACCPPRCSGPASPHETIL